MKNLLRYKILFAFFLLFFLHTYDDVTFEATNEIILNGGFEVQAGGIFEVNICGCGNP